MITDRLTARVLGLLLFVVPIVIDISCLVFAKPELRRQVPFVTMVIGPSVPMILFGIHLLRRAEKMKE